MMSTQKIHRAHLLAHDQPIVITVIENPEKGRIGFTGIAATDGMRSHCRQRRRGHGDIGRHSQEPQER
jgi:hypothetical protein